MAITNVELAEVLTKIGEDEYGPELVTNGVKSTLIGVVLTCVGAVLKPKHPLLRIGKTALIGVGIAKTYNGGCLVGAGIRPACQKVALGEETADESEEPEVEPDENETDEE